MRNACGFLHNVAKRAGYLNSSVAVHRCNLDLQQVAAGLRVCKSVYDTNGIGSLKSFGNNLSLAKEIGNVLLGDGNRLCATFCDLFCALSYKRCDLTLKGTHARFLGIIGNKRHNTAVGDLEAALGHSVALKLLGNEMVLCDRKLFGVGVGRKLDDLHSVKQGQGNRGIAVCRSDEKHIRKIDRDLHKVIAEELVLLRVKHLKQGRGRISAEVVGHLIYFIENDNGVLDLCVYKRGNDSAGHRTDVGLSVTADLRLVVHTAKRYSCIASLERLCNRRGNRGLADTGGADKADYLVFNLGGELLYSYELEYSFLNLFKTVVVLVKYFSCLGYAYGLVGLNSEGEIKTGVKIRAKHGAFRSTEGGLCKLGKLLEELGLYLLGHILCFYLFFVLAYFVVLILSKLGLNSLYLLAEEVVLLIAVDLFSDLKLNIAFASEEHCLLFKGNEKLFKPGLYVYSLKHSLLVLVIDKCARCRKIGEIIGCRNSLRGHIHIVVERGVNILDLVYGSLDLTHQKVDLFGYCNLSLSLSCGCVCDHKLLRKVKLCDLCS